MVQKLRCKIFKGPLIRFLQVFVRGVLDVLSSKAIVVEIVKASQKIDVLG